jgi:hypothetical protein
MDANGIACPLVRLVRSRCPASCLQHLTLCVSLRYMVFKEGSCSANCCKNYSPIRHGTSDMTASQLCIRSANISLGAYEIHRQHARIALLSCNADVAVAAGVDTLSARPSASTPASAMEMQLAAIPMHPRNSTPPQCVCWSHANGDYTFSFSVIGDAGGHPHRNGASRMGTSNRLHSQFLREQTTHRGYLPCSRDRSDLTSLGCLLSTSAL